MMTATVHQLGVDRYNMRKPDRVRVLLNTRLRVTAATPCSIFRASAGH
jgi:hypothetical protein